MPSPLIADPEAPSWAAQILVQFPIVGLVFLAAWWAQRHSDRRNAQHLERLDSLLAQQRATAAEQTGQLTELGKQLKKDFDRSVREVKQAYEAALTAMQARQDAELDRLGKAHAAHVRSLNAEIRRLTESRNDTGGEPRA